MPVLIHGKEYITVAERITAAGDDLIGVETEVLFQDPVVIKATITTKKGKFSGISAANPSKSIEKESPYEVAESSAVGRALAFAGYETTNGIASAEEMKKIFTEPQKDFTFKNVQEPDDMQKMMLSEPCRKCGGEMVLNPKTQRVFCKAKCWLN